MSRDQKNGHLSDLSDEAKVNVSSRTDNKSIPAADDASQTVAAEEVSANNGQVEDDSVLPVSGKRGREQSSVDNSPSKRPTRRSLRTGGNRHQTKSKNSSNHENNSTGSQVSSASSESNDEPDDSSQRDWTQASPHKNVSSEEGNNGELAKQESSSVPDVKDLKEIMLVVERAATHWTIFRLCREKVAAINCEIEAVHKGVHPELAQRLQAIENMFQSRLSAADLRKSYEVACAYENFMCCVNTADQDYQAGMKEMQQYFISKIEKAFVNHRNAKNLSTPEHQAFLRRCYEYAIQEATIRSSEKEYFLLYKERLSPDQIEHDLKLISSNINKIN